MTNYLAAATQMPYLPALVLMALLTLDVAAPTAQWCQSPPRPRHGPLQVNTQ